MIRCIVIFWVFIAFVGCDHEPVKRQARKPLLDEATLPTPEDANAQGLSSLQTTTATLRDYRVDLGHRRQRLLDMKAIAHERLREAVGEAYEELVFAHAPAISLHLRDSKSSAASIHAKEIAILARCLDRLQQECRELDGVLQEADSILRLAREGAMLTDHPSFIKFVVKPEYILQQIGNADLTYDDLPSDVEVSQILVDEFATARNEMTERRAVEEALRRAQSKEAQEEEDRKEEAAIQAAREARAREDLARTYWSLGREAKEAGKRASKRREFIDASRLLHTAIGHFDKAIELKAEYGLAYGGRSEAYFLLGEYERADQDWALAELYGF